MAGADGEGVIRMGNGGGAVSGLVRRAKAVALPFRHNLASFVGQHSGIYAVSSRLSLSLGRLHFVRARNRNLVSAATALCIEGPSGSGNSFVVTGFRLLHPDVRVAHHHHVAAQVKRAAALGLPTVVLLRHPADCVASRARGAARMIGPLYLQWLRFFRATHRLRDDVVIASFETATEHPAEVLRAVNRRFGTGFREDFPSAAAVFDEMDRAYSARQGRSAANPNRPSREKDAAKRALRPAIDGHRLREPAARLYESLRRDAV